MGIDYVCIRCGKGSLTSENSITAFTGHREIYKNGAPTGYYIPASGRICNKCQPNNDVLVKTDTVEERLIELPIKIHNSKLGSMIPEFEMPLIESESERIETTKQSLGSLYFKDPKVNFWIGRCNDNTKKLKTLYDF